MAIKQFAFSNSGVTTSGPAYATETEMVILQGRVDTLEKYLKAALEQNEELRRQILALKDGAWLKK